jgi:hypothetical protein
MTTFTNYLHWLPSQYPATDRIYLVLDLCSVHCYEARRACAIELGIVLHFTLQGGLVSFNPLAVMSPGR